MFDSNYSKPLTQIKESWGLLSSRRKSQCLLLLAVMIFVAGIEIVNIGSILPFLTALSNINVLKDNFYIREYIVNPLDLSDFEIIIASGALFFVLTILTNGARVCLLYLNTRFSYAVGADFSVSAFSNVLYQSYSTHMSRNSSSIINRITGQIATLVSSILLFLNLISSLFILTILSLIIFFIDFKNTLFIFSVLIIAYLGIYFYIRPKLSAASARVSRSSEVIMKVLQESLGGIRDIILDNSQKYFSGIFERAEHQLRRGQGNIVILSSGPKFIIETLGVFLILCFSVMLIKGSSADLVVPLLGTIAFSAQRLLPIFQQIFASWSGMIGNCTQAHHALALLAERVSQPPPLTSKFQKINFNKQVELIDISYRYPNGKVALNHISLTIQKGERIGIVGKSGSGKTTLMDILMGLLIPQSGALKVDDLLINTETVDGWRMCISHVPQFLYLADASLAENIAFGIPLADIQMADVQKSAHFAQLEKLVDQWPEKYLTNIGERGARLSGGQRQRVGIARALYKGADVILFDEATSALDADTEREVIESVENLDREMTVIMIAHRITTLRGCSRIVEIENGSVKRIGKYSDFIASS